MSPHKLRHTYATNLAEQTGGDIPLDYEPARAYTSRIFPYFTLIPVGKNNEKLLNYWISVELKIMMKTIKSCRIG